jgi:hypothetical protein
MPTNIGATRSVVKTTPQRADSSTGCSPVVDAVAEALPLGDERVEGRPAGGGEAVIAAGRAARRLPPRGLDEAVPAQAAEQGIDRPFARHHSVDLRQSPDELEAVALPFGQQRQDAVLERASPHLGQQRLLAGSYHAQQGTRFRRMLQVARLGRTQVLRAWDTFGDETLPPGVVSSAEGGLGVATAWPPVAARDA